MLNEDTGEVADKERGGAPKSLRRVANGGGAELTFLRGGNIAERLEIKFG